LPKAAAGESVIPHEVSIELAPTRRVGWPALAAAGALGLVGAFFYMQHVTSERITQALAKYRENQAVAVATASAAGLGSLEVDTKPEGCAIWINGALRSELTPAKLDSLPLERELHVKLTKDGFEPYRAVEKLTAEAPFNDLQAQMQKLSATILLQSDGRVSFNLFVDGKLWKDHSKIDDLSADEEHSLGFFSRGYAPKTLAVTLHPGETRVVDVRLAKSLGGASEPPGGSTTAGAPSVGTTPTSPSEDR
jgi:serine/threonine-protein kinase